MKKSFADIMAEMDNDFRRRISSKIPSWQGLEVPSSLSFEQCSSEKTAAYKRRFVPEGAVVADLTGGLGVDASSFAAVAKHVYYYERNAATYNAAVSNFAAMGLDNITPQCCEVSSHTDIPQCDLIFIDPARRDGAGRKVFLLEDCTPNVLELIPMLWQHTRRILLKLSPMADISLVCSRLEGVREVHVLETGTEVRELLIYMDREYSGESLIVASDTVRSFSFYASHEKAIAPSFDMVYPHTYIYAPSGAMLKAGAYNSIGLPRLSMHSHLYVTDSEVFDAGERGSLLGRFYLVEDILPFDSSTIRSLKGRWTHADVSCHDLPLRSDDLASRLGVKPGGEVRIFATPTPQDKKIIVCKGVKFY